MGTVRQILDVKGNEITCDGFRLDVVPGTETQVIIEAPSIRINRCWGELQVSLPLKPSSCQFVLSYQWVLFPAYLGHVTPSRREDGRSYPHSTVLRRSPSTGDSSHPGLVP